VCAACIPDEKSDWDIVDEHPDLGAEAVAEMADVALQVVMRILDQGMITNTSTLAGAAICGRCGAEAISASKKLCHNCLEELNQNLVKEKRDIVIEKKKEVELNGASSFRQLIEEKRR